MKIDYKQMQRIIDCVRDFGVKGTLEEKGMAFDYLVNYFNNIMKKNDAECMFWKKLSEGASSRNYKTKFYRKSVEASIKCDEAEHALNFMVELLGLIHAGYKPTGNRKAIDDMKKELASMNRSERTKYYGVVRFEESAFLPCGKKTEGCSDCDACK